jgi:hypothetical protein
MTRVNRPDRGQLMNDHLRLGAGNGIGDLIRIERVRDHRRSAQLGQQRAFRLAPCHAVNLMSRGNQTRQQLSSNRSRRSRHEHSHHQLLDRGFPVTNETRQQPRV